MDDLPDESFTLILDLVPIRDIFVLMRVSKRWAAAWLQRHDARQK